MVWSGANVVSYKKTVRRVGLRASPRRTRKEGRANHSLCLTHQMFDGHLCRSTIGIWNALFHTVWFFRRPRRPRSHIGLRLRLVRRLVLMDCKGIKKDLKNVSRHCKKSTWMCIFCVCALSICPWKYTIDGCFVFSFVWPKGYIWVRKEEGAAIWSPFLCIKPLRG